MSSDSKVQDAEEIPAGETVRLRSGVIKAIETSDMKCGGCVAGRETHCCGLMTGLFGPCCSELRKDKKNIVFAYYPRKSSTKHFYRYEPFRSAEEFMRAAEKHGNALQQLEPNRRGQPVWAAIYVTRIIVDPECGAMPGKCTVLLSKNTSNCSAGSISLSLEELCSNSCYSKVMRWLDNHGTVGRKVREAQ